MTIDSRGFAADAELEEKPFQRGIEFPFIRVFLAKLIGDFSLLGDGILAVFGAPVARHTEDFRNSADFAEWRKLVGHCFATPPEVEHVEETLKGF